jgi:hypothetical protein
MTGRQPTTHQTQPITIVMVNFATLSRNGEERGKEMKGIIVGR